MPIAFPGRRSAARALRARAHFLPWLLLALVIGISIAGAQRGLHIAQVDFFPAVQPPPALRCEPPGGFVLRLAITGQMLLRSISAGPERAGHVGAVTCRIEPGLH
jgi:hypothetical protein